MIKDENRIERKVSSMDTIRVPIAILITLPFIPFLERCGKEDLADSVRNYISRDELTTCDPDAEAWNEDEEIPLGFIRYPAPARPVIVRPGESFDISIVSESDKEGWSGFLSDGCIISEIQMERAGFDPERERLTLKAAIPPDLPDSLYSLIIENDAVTDVSKGSVRTISEYPEGYYFIHMTDTHIGWNDFCPEGETADQLTSYIEEINIIHPVIVVFTGDNVAASYGDEPAYQCLMRTLSKLEVPYLLVPGNHDYDCGIEYWYSYVGDERYFMFDLFDIDFMAIDTGIIYQNPTSYYLEDFDPEQAEWMMGRFENLEAPAILLYHFPALEFGQVPETTPLILELYGHLHYDWCTEGIGGAPRALTGSGYYDPDDELFTGGGRFRLVRIDDNRVASYSLEGSDCESIFTGSETKLWIDYTLPNDGTGTEVEANVVNELPEHFENSRIKFLMSPDFDRYYIHNGLPVKGLDRGSYAEIIVSADIPALSETVIRVDTTGP